MSRSFGVSLYGSRCCALALGGALGLSGCAPSDGTGAAFASTETANDCVTEVFPSLQTRATTREQSIEVNSVEDAAIALLFTGLQRNGYVSELRKCYAAVEASDLEVAVSYLRARRLAARHDQGDTILGLIRSAMTEAQEAVLDGILEREEAA